jgi:hypothetical protein
MIFMQLFFLFNTFFIPQFKKKYNFIFYYWLFFLFNSNLKESNFKFIVNDNVSYFSLSWFFT